jgi:two-component system phosphate regulon sensor histidine kinase PhoR
MLSDGEVYEVDMQKEFYNTISEQTNRLKRLIKNLLNLSKIEMGSLTLNSGLVKTDWLLEDSMNIVGPLAQKKNIVINKNHPDQFPSLIGDKDLLKTAIINVLGNAVKYSPEDSEISFTLMEEKNMVVFEIIDNGHGISDEDLPHIFDRFYRSGDPNIADQTGSGLGLAMTLEIIQLHGGEIEVESELGKGTHFFIRIPKEEYYIGEQ